MEVDEPVPSTNVSTIQEKLAAIAKEEVLDLDYEEPIEQEESDSGEIPDSTPPSPSKSEGKEECGSPAKEEGELEDGEITDSEDEGEIKANGVDDYMPKGKIPIASRLSRPNTANMVAPFRKEGGSRKRKNRNNRNKLDRDKKTSWERTLRSAREVLTRDSQPRDSFQRSNSRSSSPESCQIPSLLDLQMSPPPKFNPSRVPPKDLGPQVIYPNGRPNRGKNENTRRTSGKNSLKHSPRRSPSKRQRESPGFRTSPPAKRQGFSPVRDASPISSESDSWTRDENFESKRKPSKGKADNVSSIISDPWAREKTTKNQDGERKKRSSDRSCSSSSRDDRSFSRSSSSSEDGRRKNKTKSPPRGDISYYRIPKKARQSAGSDISNRRSRTSEDSRNPDRSDFNKSNKYDRSKNRRYSPSELVEKISDSESDSGNSKKQSSSASASSRSSISRSSSPALPAKYRVNVSKPRSASPISDDDVDSRKSSVSPVRKSPVKHKYVPDPVAVSPISDDSPEPEDRYKEAVLESQETIAPKPRPTLARTPSGSPPSSPPAKKVKDERVDLSQAEKLKRKQELQEELKLIEAELERKRASQNSSST